MKKRLLAMLLALMLVVSLLPVGVLAANSQGTGENLVTLDYENGNDANKHIEVYVYVGNEIKQTIIVSDAGTTYTKVSVNVNDGANYEINYVEASGGAITEKDTQSKSYSCRWTSLGETLVLNVYLVDPSHPHPVTPSGEYDGIDLAYFYLDIVQAYKLLMLHSRDTITAETKLEGATLHFYESRGGYGLSHALAFDGAADAEFMDLWGSISNAVDAADPENISGLTIKYDGKEVLIEPEQFLLDFDGDNRYDIKSTDDTQHAVLFFENTSVSGSSGYFALYDLRLVDDGGNVNPLPEGPEHVGYEFGNWATEKSGGMQFTKNTVVTDDMKIYEQMLSGAGVTAGTQIHVQNEDNELLARYVELFNAQYNASITLEDLLVEDVYNSVKIRVNGYSETQTNPDYDAGVQKNGWQNHYYLVYNRDVAGSGSASNDHIEYNDVKSITMFINVYGDDNVYAIDIMKGDNPGQFETTVGSVGAVGGDDAVWNFEMVSAPEKPNAEDIEATDGELAGAVIVDCTNAEHADKTTAPIAGTYSIGNVVATADGGYTCDITISPADAYATFYGDSHSLVSGQEAKTVTLTYDFDSKSWTNPAPATVTFTVECEGGEEPGPEPDPDVPVAPDQDDLNRLDLAVYVDCVNESATHIDYSNPFHLRANENCTVGNPVQENGVWTSTITIASGKFVTTYSDTNHTGVNHQLADGESDTKTITLIWDETDGWTTGTESVTFSVKCETPEPETMPVALFIYQNGNTTKAVETIILEYVEVGTTYRTTEAELERVIAEHYTPGEASTGKYEIEGYYNDGGWNQYRAGNKGNKLDLDNIQVGDGWYNIHVMVTDYEKVQVVIYRNGDTKTAYKTIALENMLKGDTLDTTKLNINDYYTPHKAATGFEWEGWFNDGAWNDYKDAGCPEDTAGLDEIVINGWTNVIAMVWDEFPVNYHVLDESGAEVDSNNETRTARDLNDDFWWPTVDAGYAFDGWYEKAEDIGNESKQEGLPLGLKKYELYGELVSLAPEAGPNEDDLAQLTVRVNDNKNAPVNHGGINLGLIEGCYDVGEIVEKDGIYTVTVTPTVAEYAKQYDIAKGFVEGSHTATTTQGKVNFIFTWTDGEWVLTSENSVTIGVKCSVTVPTADELAELLQIRVKDYAGAEELPVGVTDHGQFVTGILEDTYSITGPTAENNTFVATVTLTDGSAYAAAYDENSQLEAGTHALTTTVSKLDPITLTYDFTTGTWSASNTGWSLGVKCEQVINTIHVSFVGPNGEAYGGGDVISTMPDVSVEIADPVAEGKTFVGWKKLVGLEEIYTGEFTYTALAALVGDNFTPDTHETWLEFEAVFEDEIIEPDPYNIINIRFVDSDGTTSLGGGDVISTSPDAAYPSVPSPVAPQGMEFAGWKVWLGSEPMYEGEFTFNALKALKEELDGEITWDDGRTWITFQAVYEDVTVEPDPGVTGFTKTLVTDRDLYNARGIAYPDFYRGTVIVDEGDRVTLIYNITVKGTAGTEFTVRDDSADFAQTGVIPSSGETSFYVAKTFSWRDVRNAGDTLDNTASVSVDGETVKTDTERVPVDIDWDINVPDIDDDDDDDVAEPDDEYIPNWLNTTDHYSYIVGYEDGTIRPGNNITRAEVATIFYRLLSEGSSERWYSASNSFSDVAADSWYNVPVSTLSNMGIIDGYEDGTFKPNAPITRAEFTAIATRFFDYTAEYEGAFNDVTYSDWYAECVQAAVDMGLVNGYADGGFHPNAYITRAESCAIVNRVLNRVPHEDYLLDEDEMITWPDNRYGAWYYADMQEATNSHDYDWISVSGEVVEEWTDKLTEPNW